MSNYDNGFARAQQAYEAQTPPSTDYPILDPITGEEIWDDDAPCTCEPDQGDDGQPILYRKNCQRHSEPPCDRCGWQSVCPDCDPRRPWED